MAKTYTAPTTVSAGDALTASLYNTYVGTNVANLIVPPAVSAVRSTSLSVPNTAGTLVPFNATDKFDTDAMHDTVTNNTRLTINTAGIYTIGGQCVWDGSGVGRRLHTIIRYDSAGSTVESYQVEYSPSTTFCAPSWSLAMSCSVGDYLSFEVYQSSGGALSLLSAIFSAVWIGRTS